MCDGNRRKSCILAKEEEEKEQMVSWRKKRKSKSSRGSRGWDVDGPLLYCSRRAWNGKRRKRRKRKKRSRCVVVLKCCGL